MKSNYLNSKAIQKLIFTLLQSYKEKFPETLPSHILERQRLMLRNDALRIIHFPQDLQTLEKARFRLKFEELFYIQLNILRLKNQQLQYQRTSF
jgi:ATP-dependent DNA helicase RecG